MGKSIGIIKENCLTRTEYELSKPITNLSQKNRIRLAVFRSLPFEDQLCLDRMIIRIVEEKKIHGIGWLGAFEIVAGYGEFLAKKDSA